MAQFFLRRILLIPLVLLIIHFLSFSFAHITHELQLAQTVYGSGREGVPPVWSQYQAFAQQALRGDLGQMPGSGSHPILEELARAAGASLGLLALAFLLSIGIGLLVGLGAVQVDPPRRKPWLPAAATLGLAMPSFYVGFLLVAGILLFGLHNGEDPILPVIGFGWDAHLILPVLALVIRPAMQVAQVSSSLLTGELGKRYVVAARSFGHTWRAIRWDKALRNVLAPVIISIAGAFRLMVAELVLVEWLFNWPGLGRMLVQTLVPPRISSLAGMADVSQLFLYPPLVAALLVVFALLFLLADTLASGLARVVDPRMNVVEEEAIHE